MKSWIDSCHCISRGEEDDVALNGIAFLDLAWRSSMIKVPHWFSLADLGRNKKLQIQSNQAASSAHLGYSFVFIEVVKCIIFFSNVSQMYIFLIKHEKKTHLASLFTFLKWKIFVKHRVTLAWSQHLHIGSKIGGPPSCAYSVSKHFLWTVHQMDMWH